MLSGAVFVLCEEFLLTPEAVLSLFQLHEDGTLLLVALLQSRGLEIHLPLEVGFVSIVLCFRGDGSGSGEFIELPQPSFQNFRGSLSFL